MGKFETLTPDGRGYFKQLEAWLEAGRPHTDGQITFYMPSWCDQGNLCGTTMCMGGYLEYLITGEVPFLAWETLIEEVCGLSHIDASKLFFPDSSYDPPVILSEVTAEIALATLRNFLYGSGEVVWPAKVLEDE